MEFDVLVENQELSEMRRNSNNLIELGVLIQFMYFRVVHNTRKIGIYFRISLFHVLLRSQYIYIYIFLIALEKLLGIAKEVTNPQLHMEEMYSAFM